MANQEGTLPPSRSYASFRDIDLPQVERISERVIRILGCNPGPYTLQGTNTYIVGKGKERILIDTGEARNREYITILKETLESLNVTLERILVTHHHRDHVGGAKEIVEDVISPSSRPFPVSKLPRNSEPDATDSAPDGYNFLKDCEVISTEGARLKVVHTPGHTDDHMGLLLEEEGVFFSGDCILGQTRPVFEDMDQYEKSLRRIKALGRDVQRIFPGHGPIIEDPKAKLEDYLQSIERRERLIMNALRGAKSASLSTVQIVDQIYLDISPVLKFGAVMTVRNHLRKLVKDRKVNGNNDKWSFANRFDPALSYKSFH